MIIIVDYGMGNLGAIKNMLKKIGAESEISSQIEDIEKADKLILPGVGAFDNGMANLRKLDLIAPLNHRVFEDRIPILGICLGMQLITRKSEEGTLNGLGWLDAQTIKIVFNSDNNLKIPHMGWNTVTVNKDSVLFTDMHYESRFYFAHSYHVKCACSEDILTTTNYGIDFISSFERDNIFGVQFHPEKSHKFGMKLLKNFAENA